MNLEEWKEEKKRRGLNNAQISEQSGVPEATLAKIFAGITKNPRTDTVKAIEQVLYPYRKTNCAPFFLQDSVPGYSISQKKQGSYTLPDLQKAPEGVLFELIDGFLYDLSAPTVSHQLALENFRDQVRTYIRSKGGSCVPLLGPVGVFPEEDDSSYVIPDFTITCDRSKIKEDGIHGAPDFVLEVLSPATEIKDRYVKFTKYSISGVREYWIIDGRKKTVMVNRFENRVTTQLHPLSGKLPIGIFSGECLVDLDEIAKEMSFFR